MAYMHIKKFKLFSGATLAALGIIYLTMLTWRKHDPRHFIRNFPILHAAFSLAATEPVPLCVSLYMRLDGKSRDYARAAVIKYSEASDDIVASMAMEYVVREFNKWSLGKPSFFKENGDSELRRLGLRALSSSSRTLRKSGLATYSAAISSGFWKPQVIIEDKVLDLLGQQDDELKAFALDLSQGKKAIIYIWE